MAGGVVLAVSPPSCAFIHAAASQQTAADTATAWTACVAVMKAGKVLPATLLGVSRRTVALTVSAAPVRMIRS